MAFDVKDLYANIPLAFGLEDIKYWLKNHLENFN